MSTIRGRGRSLEIAIDRALPAATVEIREQLEERPAFFRGSRAAANFGLVEADLAGLIAFRDLLASFGITLDGVSGVESLAPLVAQLDLAYLGATPADEVAAIPRPRAKRNTELSDGARSLVADFAGARADLAARRTEREAAAYERRNAVAGPPVASAPVASAGVTIPAVPQSAPAGVSTLYHRGTLRGGQTLHNLGNIIVIGDVNPGAELIASGDVVVFGSLRGVAHAGAQGDASARVVALELAPTQLRIATMIAAPDAAAADAGPQHAYILGDRITIVPHAAADLGRREVIV
jgi:septum site-determining protein MinC